MQLSVTVCLLHTELVGIFIYLFCFTFVLPFGSDLVWFGLAWGLGLVFASFFHFALSLHNASFGSLKSQ